MTYNDISPAGWDGGRRDEEDTRRQSCANGHGGCMIVLFVDRPVTHWPVAGVFHQQLTVASEQRPPRLEMRMVRRNS